MPIDIGIDLGTANSLVAVKGKGIVVSEPSVVGLDRVTHKVLKVGNEAFEMAGKTPENIVVIRPLKSGVIADDYTTEIMVKYLISKAKAHVGAYQPVLLLWNVGRWRMPAETLEQEMFGWFRSL